MAGRTKPKRKRATPRVIRHYTPWHELMASPTEPLPQEWRTHHLTRMWQGLVALEELQYAVVSTAKTDDVSLYYRDIAALSAALSKENSDN